MQTHTVKVKLEADGELVLHDLPFARGDVVEVNVLADHGATAKLTSEELARSEAIRESLRGSVTFADDFDPGEPACPPEHWHALDPEYKGP